MSAKDNHDYQDNDERMARDMQLALDLQMAEDFAAQQDVSAVANGIQGPAASSSNESFQVEHGFYNIQQQNDHMLFVACTIDSRKVNMLVDSGASVSAMSLAIVHKLGLQDKLNVAISGACGGVGSANIVGVVENLACLVGQVEFRLYFLVIDSELPSVVFGLDQMRRFQCVIDMESDCLCFGGRDGVQVPFLTVQEARKARKDYDRMIRGTAAGATRQATRTQTGRAVAGSSSGSTSWIPSLFGRNRPGSG